MAAAIRLCGGRDTIERVNFIEKMDKFFDCFNVSTFTAGKHQRKPFLEPYHSHNTDFRLTVSTFVNTAFCFKIASYMNCYILLLSSF